MNMQGRARPVITSEDLSWTPRRDKPQRGLLLLASPGQKAGAVFSFGVEEITIGRDLGDGLLHGDAWLSRCHARVRLDGDVTLVRDEKSRNGTYVDGEGVSGMQRFFAPRVLRVGHSVFAFVVDVRPYRLGVMRCGNQVVGPTLGRVRQSIAIAARAGGNLLITGESGSGKELAARAFHEFGPHPTGPFVAVNCAAIQDGMTAERLLFGIRRGARSGVVEDADGSVQAANGGTLFLDEIGDLPLPVQGKLLRLLESGEVVPLGASRARTVELRVCAATVKDLGSEAAAGRFRKDLYFRLACPEVRVPPLRERVEELPLLIEGELRRDRLELTAHPGLYEAILLRPWTGNVRELLRELRRMATEVASSGRTELRADDLSPRAGWPLTGRGPEGPLRDNSSVGLRRDAMR